MIITLVKMTALVELSQSQKDGSGLQKVPCCSITGIAPPQPAKKVSSRLRIKMTLCDTCSLLLYLKESNTAPSWKVTVSEQNMEMRRACSLSFLSQKLPSERNHQAVTVTVIIKIEKYFENYHHWEEASNDSSINSLLWPFSFFTFHRHCFI